MLETLVSDIGAFMAAHRTLALVIVFLAAAGESLFLVGLFVPGTAVLVAAGTLAGAGRLPLTDILAVSAAGAFLGNSASYWFGRRYRDTVARIRPFPRYRTMLRGGEAFFARYGAAGLFASHFVPGVKTVVPALAGAMGMGFVAFVAVTILSAAVWSAALILPSVWLGMGLSSLAEANPRLLALGLFLLVFLWVVWRVARLAADWLWPRGLSLLQALADRAVARGIPGAGAVAAVAHNRGGIVAPILWVALAGAAVAGFVDLTLDLTMGETLAASDSAVSNFIRAFRSPPADAVLVAVTMLGDGVVLLAAVIAMIAALLVHRDWRTASAVAVATGAAAAFVPFAKDLLGRARPLSIYEGADAFSFPSGHASLSMTIFGVAAVLLARGSGQARRLTIYATATAMAVLIAFTRVYLAAHWPSDVAAGLLFGAAVVSAFALSVHNRPVLARPAALAVAVAVAVGAAYAANVQIHRADWAATFAVERPPLAIARADWLSGQWKTLPLRRIEFTGETGEGLIVQSDAPPDSLAEAFRAAGWTLRDDPGLGIVGALPSAAPFDDRLPLPLFHDGRPAVLVATHPVDGEGRLVLRFWSSGYAADGERPILVGSVSRETTDDLAFGYSVVEDDDAGPAASAMVDAVLGAAPGIVAVRPDDGSDRSAPLLATAGDAAPPRADRADDRTGG